MLLCSGRSNLKSIYYLLLSNDGSFYFTQDRFFFRNKSCSCTTCIVYVNLFKDRFFYVGFLFRKADAKVKTFKYIFQIFSEVFFHLSFSRHLSCERENKRKIVLPTRIQEKVSTNAAYFLKAGAKVRTLFHIFQMFSEVFFHSAFSKGRFQKETSPKQKKYVRVPTPFLSECQNIAAPVLESGCKSRTL